MHCLFFLALPVSGALCLSHKVIGAKIKSAIIPDEQSNDRGISNEKDEQQKKGGNSDGFGS